MLLVLGDRRVNALVPVDKGSVKGALIVEEMHAGQVGRMPAELAVLVRPTPLQAVRDVSRAGELMPQKSTFFYPKLATGLALNPLS